MIFWKRSDLEMLLGGSLLRKMPALWRQILYEYSYRICFANYDKVH